jgi:phage virion morphogenesis protein
MGVTKTSRMGLPELRKQLGGLASPAFRVTMARNLAEEARTQVANGFRGERNPYGIGWAPLKTRQGMILQDTGRLRASVATQATAAGFRIDMPVVYAAPHQYGSRKKKGRRGRGRLPQRQMIPMESTGGLGPIWSAAFRETSQGLIDKYLARGAA